MGSHYDAKSYKKGEFKREYFQTERVNESSYPYGPYRVGITGYWE